MNLSPETFAESFKQGAFISALIAGFSFAFLSVILTNSNKKFIDQWTAGFAIAATAGLTVCSVVWTILVSRVLFLLTATVNADSFQIPTVYIEINRLLSNTFTLCFFLFLTSLGLSGWIRSKPLGLVSSIISILAAIYSIWLIKLL